MSFWLVRSTCPHWIAGPVGSMTVLVLVSVAFTVLEIWIAAPVDVPPPSGAAVDVDSLGQAPSADEEELEPVLLEPEEQAVSSSPRATAPVTVMARRLRMAMTRSFRVFNVQQQGNG